MRSHVADDSTVRNVLHAVCDLITQTVSTLCSGISIRCAVMSASQLRRNLDEVASKYVDELTNRLTVDFVSLRVFVSIFTCLFGFCKFAH